MDCCRGLTGGNVAPGDLFQDAAGNVYGTTCCGGSGFGTVFKVDPSGTMTVLYTFTGGPDGVYPKGNLVLDAAGNIYGTTVSRSGSSGFNFIDKNVGFAENGNFQWQPGTPFSIQKNSNCGTNADTPGTAPGGYCVV